MEFEITYGSAFAIDKWGFVGKGEMRIDENNITFSGRRAWPAWKKLLTGLIIFAIPTLLFKFGLAFVLPTFVIVHYLCVSYDQVSVSRSSISELKHKGKKVTFIAQDSHSEKTQKSLFKVNSNEATQALISALSV